VAGDDPLIPVPIPALVALLWNLERQKGEPLTEAEVLKARDGCACIMMPASIRDELAKKRGYADIDPENAWSEWQAARAELRAAPSDSDR
jgi:hypothetical protein